jgi:glycine oxidase
VPRPGAAVNVPRPPFGGAGLDNPEAVTSIMDTFLRGKPLATTVGVVGAGLAGRLLALALARAGRAVTVFEQHDDSGRRSCAWTGAGMIAPYCEQESAERIICELGLRALELWPQWLETLAAPVFYQSAGSLVVAHPRDAAELQRLEREVRARGSGPDVLQLLDTAGIGQLEPELAGRFHRGLFFPREAQIDNWQLLPALLKSLTAAGVTCRFNTAVTDLKPGRLTAAGQERQFDLVCDCRGLGAEADLPDLRGVRGELLHVTAPDVKLQRPVRMMHPRYPLYIVPREQDRYVIGATKIESNDLSPISVRGDMELLTAAYALHPGFAEARIIETSTHCRPAMRNNLPLVEIRPGLVRLNGMFRHGFLIAPALVEGIVSQLTRGRLDGVAAEIAQVTP